MFCFSGIGQTRIDSITKLLQKASAPSEKARLYLKRAPLFNKTDQEKAFSDVESASSYYQNKKDEKGITDSYIAYGNIYFNHNEPLKAAHYDSLAIQLAEKISYEKGRAIAIGNLGREFINTSNFNEAVILLKEAIAKEESFKPLDKDRLAELYNRQGVAVGAQGDYIESLALIEKAMELSRGSKDNLLLSNIYNNYANVLSRLSKVDKAVEVHYMTIRLCEKIKDSTGLLRAYNNLGIAFRNAGEFDKAITYYKKSIELAKKAANYKSLGLSLVNLATVYSHKEQFDGMDTLYNQGIGYFEKASDIAGIAFANHNYGNFLLNSKKYVEADSRLQKAYELRKKIGAELAAASSLSVLGKSALEQEKWNEAENYLLAAEEIYEGKSKDNRSLMELYGYLKKLYTQEGNYEKAFQYQKQELELERTLFTENERINALKAETEYELEKRDMQLALEKGIQQRNKQRFIFIGAGIAVLLLFSLLMLWLRRRQLRERHNAHIQNLNQEHRLNLTRVLKNAEQQERKKVAHKLHDETGSMLSIAILNIKQLQNDIFNAGGTSEERLETTQKILVDVSTSIRNISHTLMPVALEKQGLKAAILDLVGAVNTSKKIKIEEIIEGLDDTRQWSEEFCLTVYRIVQEVLNNIIKHAQATHVLLQIVELEDSVTIYIEDNGKGLDEAVTVEGVGLKLLKSNVEYLNGTIEINGRKNAGTFILAELPIEKKPI